MKRLLLQRLYHNYGPTIGAILLDGKFQCWTLEDPPQDQKIPGRTRIPAGQYDILLRQEGGMHQDYSTRFVNEHEGMLELQDVPNFSYIYIHIGNYAKDTEGCILVGKMAYKERVTSSTDTYFSLYEKVVDDAARGSLKIRIQDENVFIKPKPTASLASLLRSVFKP